MALYGRKIDGMSNATMADLGGVEEDYISQAGVVNLSTDFIVSQNGTPNRSVNVSYGTARILNNGYSLNQNIIKFLEVQNTATVNVSLTANSSGNPRIDIICIKYDNAAIPDANASNVFSLVVVEGTPAASPAVPATPANHLKLAEIAIANGYTQILTANITDRRVVCGLDASKLSNIGNSDPLLLLQGVHRQCFVDGGSQINQVLSSPSLSTSYQYGGRDLFIAKCSGVTAGTITQTSSPNVSSASGFADKLSGVSATAGQIGVKLIVEAKNALKYKNKTASFGLNVYHNVGSNINYTIKINKPNSADNYAAKTNIYTSSTFSVASATSTEIKVENISMGDCSNGFEMEVLADCGTITTKDFEFADWHGNSWNYLLSMFVKSFENELQDVMRHYEKSYDYSVAPGSISSAGSYGFTSPSSVAYGEYMAVSFSVRKRSSPTCSLYSTVTGTIDKIRNIVGGSDVAITSANINRVGEKGFSGTGIGLSLGVPYEFNWTANSRITAGV